MSNFLNEYPITVDLKRGIAQANSIPAFVQNDSAVIYVKILDNGKPYDYVNADRYVFSFRRFDGQEIQGLGSYDTETGTVKYELGTTEMHIEGNRNHVNLECAVQLYLGTKRVTTRSFNIRIYNDYEEAIESSKDLTLLQELFLEVQNVKDDTIAAGQFATDQGNFAKGIRENFGHKGEYDNTKVYKDGNVVSYGGINYMCILETTAGINPLNGTYWAVVSPQATINEQTWTATEGQRTFTLTNGKYVVGKGNIEVVVGGVRQLKDQGYGESSETTITLTEGVPAGTVVYAKWFEGHMYIAKGHQSSHAMGGQDEIDVTQLRNFKEKVTDEITRVDTQLAENAKDIVNRTAHTKDYVIEKSGVTHSGGYIYTAFLSGASIGGKEVYVGRNARGHTTTPGNEGVIVAYTRQQDGSFVSKILSLDYSIGDYRDPNITVDPSGKYLILTATAYNYETAKYTGWLYLLDSDLNIIGNKVSLNSASDPESEIVFFWGNTLVTPSGKLLKCAYLGGDAGGVYLYRSSGDINNIGTFTRIAAIANPNTTYQFTEPTIAYWGNKLVAIMRGNKLNGNFAITDNLEGDDGWKGNYMSFRLVSPVLEPYINSTDILIAGIGFPQSSERKPALIATADGKKWSSPVTIGGSGAGSYPTLVKNNYGYGVMWYLDGTSNGSDVYFRDIDPERLIGNLGYFKQQLSQGAKSYVIARHSTSQSVATTTGTKLLFDTVDYDPTAIRSTTDFTKFICNSKGIYDIKASAQFSAATGLLQLSIIVNNASVALQSTVGDGINKLNLTVGTTVKLNVGDYVQIFTFKSSTGTVNVESAGQYTPVVSMTKLMDV